MSNHENSWSNSSSTTTPSHPANRYGCLTCRLVFPDAQALEVHQSAHRRWWGALFAQRRVEKSPNVSPNPLTSAGDPQAITNIKRVDFHSMGNPGGSNMKLVEALASGTAPSSGAKNPSTDDDLARDPNPKNGDKDADLKIVMPRPNLTLGSGTTECGSLEEVLDSESDFDWEDDEEFIMPFYDGDCEASDSERVVPDSDDLDL